MDKLLHAGKNMINFDKNMMANVIYVRLEDFTFEFYPKKPFVVVMALGKMVKLHTHPQAKLLPFCTRSITQISSRDVMESIKVYNVNGFFANYLNWQWTMPGVEENVPYNILHNRLIIYLPECIKNCYCIIDQQPIRSYVR